MPAKYQQGNYSDLPIHRSSRLFQFYFPYQGLLFGHLKVWGWHPLHLLYLFHDADLAQATGGTSEWKD